MRKEKRTSKIKRKQDLDLCAENTSSLFQILSLTHILLELLINVYGLTFTIIYNVLYCKFNDLDLVSSHVTFVNHVKVTIHNYLYINFTFILSERACFLMKILKISSQNIEPFTRNKYFYAEIKQIVVDNSSDLYRICHFNLNFKGVLSHINNNFKKLIAFLRIKINNLCSKIYS